jgi:hypothetical protein
LDNEEHLGGISCMALGDITESGTDDVIVGRDDGYEE